MNENELGVSYISMNLRYSLNVSTECQRNHGPGCCFRFLIWRVWITPEESFSQCIYKFWHWDTFACKCLTRGRANRHSHLPANLFRTPQIKHVVDLFKSHFKHEVRTFLQKYTVLSEQCHEWKTIGVNFKVIKVLYMRHRCFWHFMSRTWFIVKVNSNVNVNKVKNNWIQCIFSVE